MKLWPIEVSRLFHISLEMLLLYMIIQPFLLLENHAPTAITYIFFVAIGLLSFDPFVRKFKNIKLALILVPIGSVVGLFLGYPLLFSMIIASVVFWRVVHHHKELKFVYENIHKWGKQYKKDESSIELNLFLATFLIGAIYYLLFYFLEGRELFLYIVFIQFFLVKALKIFNLSFRSKKMSYHHRQQLKWQLGKVVILGAITISAFLLFPLVQSIIGLIMRIAFQIISYIGAVFVYLFSFIGFEPRSRNGETGEVLLGNSELPVPEALTLYDSIYVWLFLIPVIAIILFFVIKSNGKFSPREEALKTNEQALVETNLTVVEKENFWKKLKPRNEIRKLFFQLEQYLAKKGKGRNYYSSVEEWFDNIKGNEAEKEIISKIYHKVRYGESEVTKEEKAAYREAMKEMKRSWNSKDNK